MVVTCCVLVLVSVAGKHASADLLLYEGFDADAGLLDNQAGATSFGFHPTLGLVWDSGVFASPQVASGSIDVPASVQSFYTPAPIGNRYFSNEPTVVGRVYDLKGQHFFGSFLTTTSLNGVSPTPDSLYNFQNFFFRAVQTDSGPVWRMDRFDFFNTGISADGTTLITWELIFNQVSAPDTFRIWFNHNPLTDPPDFESSSFELGYNRLGNGGFLVFHSNLYLGQSTLDIDEIRIGTDWSSVGINSFLLGDVNLDGTVNLLDVSPFIDRLSTGTYQAEADINQDGVVNLLDVQPFVNLLAG